ncbi:hypothetical protein WA158_002724 [Blastocystis sp. Blastoise]
MNIPLIISVSSPGKVILFGEHSVVYGNYALAASLSDMRTTLELYRLDSQEFIIDIQNDNYLPNTEYYNEQNKYVMNVPNVIRLFQNLSLEDINSDPLISKDLLQKLKLECSSLYSRTIISFCYMFTHHSEYFLNEKNQGYYFRIYSNSLPCGAGLGSSSSLSVSLATIIYHLDHSKEFNHNPAFWNTPSHEQLISINKIAYISECIYHGTPSGVDNSVSCFGNAILFKKGSIEYKTCPSLSLLVVNTNIPKNTKELVSKVRHLRECIPTIIDPLFQSINEQIFYLLDSQNEDEYYERVQRIIPICQHILISLGINHPSIDYVTSAIQNYLHIPSKLTGAGGGGCVICFLPKELDFHKDSSFLSLVEELVKNNMNYYVTQVGGKGVQYYLP